jgi:hypothetical protein
LRAAQALTEEYVNSPNCSLEEKKALEKSFRTKLTRAAIHLVKGDEKKSVICCE